MFKFSFFSFQGKVNIFSDWQKEIMSETMFQ